MCQRIRTAGAIRLELVVRVRELFEIGEDLMRRVE